MSYDRMVLRYMRDHRRHQRRWLRYYRRMRTLRQTIEHAAAALGPDGRKFSHQWRIPPAVLSRARRNLVAAQRDLRRCTSFDMLHDLVKERIARIRGIGELTVYDTSLRIGAFLRLLPRKVYLHAGTREGFVARWGDPGARIIPKRRFPESVRQLRAYEIEDFLCIYRDELAGDAHAGEVNSCYSPSGRLR